MEVNNVGMRIDSISINTFDLSGIHLSTSKLIEFDIVQLWESTYIPALWSGAGNLEQDISGDSGSKIIITLHGHDDNQYSISATDTLTIN